MKLINILIYMLYANTGCIKKKVDSLFCDNYSDIPRSIALADMANEREHQY